MPASALAAALPLPEPVRLHGRPARAIADHETPLIRRAQAADPNAFGELYRRHEPQVRRFLASRLFKREAEVDDLVAETFLTAMQRIAAFEPERPGEFGNWLVGIARNKLLSSYQRGRREMALDDSLAGQTDGEAASPEEVALDRLEVAEALSRLRPRTRRALVLRYAVGLPCAEVALALGTNKRMVWELTSRARLELRGEARHTTRGAAPGAERSDGEATIAGSGRAAARVLCACGCGSALPAARAHNRRYATTTCRNRAAWRRRKEAQRRYLAGPAAADPAVERVLAIVRATGGAGITRAELARRTRLLAARLDRALDLLAARWSVSVVLEPCDGRLVMRYRPAADLAAGRAA